eukprot:gene4282-biopygen6009
MASVVMQKPAAQELLRQLEQPLLPKLDQCALRQLCNTAWSCSKLKHTQTLLFSSCKTRFIMQQKAQVEQPQDVSNVLWAAANSRYAMSPEQVQQVVGLLMMPRLLQRANPQEVSNTIWAVATMGQQLEPMQPSCSRCLNVCSASWSMPHHKLCPTPSGLWQP